MKFSSEFGIEITEGVLQLLQKAVTHAGNKLQLSKQIKVGFSTLNNWIGINSRKGQYITWDQWKPLRDYLASRGEIDRADPRWMLPSELRNALETVSAARDDDEARLLQLYRALTPDGQQTALNLMQSLQATLNKAPSGSAPSATSAG